MAEARALPEPSSRAGLSRVAVFSLHTSPTASLGHSANGGMNVYIRQLCVGLSQLGVATDIFTRSLAGDKRVEQLAPLSRVINLPAGPQELDKYRLLEQVPIFTEGVRAFMAEGGLHYDAMYSHYWLSGMVACALRGSLRVPWAHTAHTLAIVKNRLLAPGDRPEPEVRVDLEGEVARCADLLIVNTQAEALELLRAYGVRQERLAVVAPGCDLGAFEPRPRQAAREALGYPEQRLFVFAGRLERLKGVDVLIRALAELTADGARPELRLLIIGGDSHSSGESERQRLATLAERLGVTGQVSFTGPLPQERLAGYYAAAEAVLLPSYNESFGLVALEAQASGTPVIASNVPGLALVVSDGRTGFLVNGHDPRDYVDRMRQLLESPRLVEAMGSRAARRARGFSWDRTTERVHALLSEAVSKTTAAGAGLGSSPAELAGAISVAVHPVPGQLRQPTAVSVH
ncbi:MAG: glycosyltransferase [Candidatus Dormibacteraeota bacterium]|nr:glycosyltransferase [Candidatus Dormibacteraeota bacterium]